MWNYTRRNWTINLNASNINNVNFAKNTLEKLYAYGGSGITQKGIEQLTKLKVLDIGGNRRIKDVNFAKDTLEELNGSRELVIKYKR